MDEKHYMISDAAKLIHVETHVLRYWEEELKIDIPRNEMGHRYYTDTYIQLFQEIKHLKEQGFLLKAIKGLMPELLAGKSFLNEDAKTITSLIRGKQGDKEHAVSNLNEEEESLVGDDKVEQFRMILGGIVSQAMEDNNEILGKEVSMRVSDTVIKEMDYLLRLKEEREEERYKKFDEVLRNYQKGTKEAAATKEKRGLFRKKKKEKKGTAK